MKDRTDSFTYETENVLTEMARTNDKRKRKHLQAYLDSLTEMLVKAETAQATSV